MRKFEFIGVPVKDNVVCALHKSSGVINLQQGSAAHLSGICGQSDISRALVPLDQLNGQLEGGLQATWTGGLQSGNVNIVIQATAKALRNTPRKNTSQRSTTIMPRLRSWQKRALI